MFPRVSLEISGHPGFPVDLLQPQKLLILILQLYSHSPSAYSASSTEVFGLNVISHNRHAIAESEVHDVSFVSFEELLA
jgi:hypothetical protein